MMTLLTMIVQILLVSVCAWFVALLVSQWREKRRKEKQRRAWLQTSRWE